MCDPPNMAGGVGPFGPQMFLHRAHDQQRASPAHREAPGATHPSRETPRSPEEAAGIPVLSPAASC